MRDEAFLTALAQQIPEEQRSTLAQAELVAQVRVSAAGHQASASITVIDRLLDAPAGARELSLATDDCTEIAEAVALVLAVLVEAGRGGQLSEAEVEQPPAEPEVPSSPPPPAPVVAKPEIVPEKPKRYRWLGPRSGHDLVVGIGPAYGLLPGLTWAGTFAWGIRVHDVWPIWLSAVLQPPTSVAVTPRAGSEPQRAWFSTAYGGLHGCPLAVGWTRLRLRACPGISVGVLSAEGRGFLAQKATRQLLGLAGLELAADILLRGAWTVGLTTRVDVPLSRTRFVYYQEGGATPELHEARLLTIQAFLTTGVRFH